MSFVLALVLSVCRCRCRPAYSAGVESTEAWRQALEVDTACRLHFRLLRISALPILQSACI